jgi:hypothetical protein
VADNEEAREFTARVLERLPPPSAGALGNGNRGRKRDVATIGCLSIIWRKIALACARCRRCRRRWSWRPPRRGLRKRTSDRGPCLFQWVETDHGRPRPLALCAHGDGLNFSCASYIDTSSRVRLVVRSYHSNPRARRASNKPSGLDHPRVPPIKGLAHFLPIKTWMEMDFPGRRIKTGSYHGAKP